MALVEIFLSVVSVCLQSYTFGIYFIHNGPDYGSNLDPDPDPQSWILDVLNNSVVPVFRGTAFLSG